MIFVTGGTGLVGAHLLYDMTSQGLRVRALKRVTSDVEGVRRLFALYTSEADVLYDRIEWVEGDILDYPSLLQAMQGARQVYHTAVIGSHFSRNVQEDHRGNVQGTLNVVHACTTLEVRKLCYLSSVATLDASRPGLPVNEQCRWVDEWPHTPFAHSKRQAEQYVWQAMFKGLHAVVLHPGMILGPDVRGGALHNLFTVLRGGCWFYPLGFCGLVDVRDVSRAAITLMESDIQGERFLLVAENSSFRGLFREISRRFRRKPPCIPLVPALKTLLLRVRKGFFPGPCMMSRPFDGAQPLRRRFDGQRITRRISFTYTPLSQTLDFLCGLYRSRRL